MPPMARDFSRLPPAVICAAGLDVILPDALEYAAALEAAGVPQRLIVVRGLPHRFLRTFALLQCRRAGPCRFRACPGRVAALPVAEKTAAFGIEYLT